MDKGFFCKTKKVFFPCRANKYKPRFLNSKFLLYYALFLLILKLAIVPFLFYFPHTAFFAELTKVNLFELANASRDELGFHPLRENAALNQAAHLKATDMFEKDYFAHHSPEGITPWYWLERSDYGYAAAGENLAIGFLESEQVHRAWMNSPSHQKNILNPNYQEMGIAVLKGYFQGRETTLVVQFFGTPRTEPYIPEILPEEPESPALVEEDQAVKEPEDAVVVEEEVMGEEELTEEEPIEEEPIEEEPIEGEKEPEPIFAVESIMMGGDIEKTSAFSLFHFMTSDYYSLVQGAIYGSLVLILISLFVTVFCDVFVYRKFKIDHKDVVFKTISFSALWFVLLFLDKMIMVELISSQKLLIY